MIKFNKILNMTSAGSTTVFNDQPCPDCNHDFEHITFREVQCIHCDKIIYA